MAASTAGTIPDPTAVPPLDWDDIWEVGQNPAVRAAVTATYQLTSADETTLTTILKGLTMAKVDTTNAYPLFLD